MKFKLSCYYEKDISKKPLYQRPLTFYIIAFLLLILAAVLHRYDTEYKNWIQLLRANTHIPSLGSFFDIIKLFGDGKIVVFVALVIGAIGHRKTAYRILLTLLLVGIIVSAIKPIAHRERPNGRNHLSFPSGDSATAAALFVPLAAEAPVLAPTLAFIPGVAFLRNYSNWHYLSDVIAGIAFGLLATGLALKFDIRKNKYIRLLKSRYLALLSVLLAVIFILPDIFKAGGKFFDFMSLYGGILCLVFVVNYVPMFYKKRSDKCKSPLKFAIFCKNIVKKYEIQNLHTYKLILSDIFLSVLSVAALILVWTSDIGDLGIPISGLLLLCFLSILYRRRLVKKKCFIKAQNVPFMSLVMLILFAVITLLPAIIKFYCK